MNIELAISIALQAHKGQLDKGGQRYILHPLAVMNRIETMEEKIVAVLHDVIEDTDVTIEELREFGFSEEILHAICLLTRSKEDTYEQFIEKTLMNPIARNVKIADIKENMNISRIKNPTEHDYNRLEKYRKAIERLEEHMTEPVPFFHVNELMGTWSSEAFFYDAFEDTQLEFHADGTGCHAFLRPYGQDITLFRWKLMKDRIDFEEYFQVSIEVSENTNEEQHSTESLENNYSARFFKAKGLNVANQEIDVIVFYSPLIEGVNSQSFGMISTTWDRSLTEVARKYEKDML
ncbi:hypothetical protein [Paenibacillus sp. TSA_86.1]|uniref:hypothetical protein n=1 Tax=Paenibacillus sp. TSA_86.1 TaxID=3415649 RepID=UPI004045EF32